MRNGAIRKVPSFSGLVEIHPSPEKLLKLEKKKQKVRAGQTENGREATREPSLCYLETLPRGGELFVYQTTEEIG